MFERYVRIDDKTFSFAELAKLVGIDNDNPMVSLVQDKSAVKPTALVVGYKAPDLWFAK